MSWFSKKKPEIHGFEDFKSAKELKLSEKQRCALIKTLAHMEAGTLLEAENHAITAFNMRVWGGPGCGSVCCIGGSAEVLGGLKRGSLSDASHRSDLHQVFSPYREGSRAWMSTPTQAARVLRHFLNTGTADWSKVEG